ncbi:MAG: site-2 protease family protein [Deltaproteobacteria bacterium]|nr:site-2 protease family protein [Deltaproteobacteria bacterium]
MFQDYILKILITGPPILLALTVHECAHAWTAYKLGDPTAKMLGRVTLNPLRHLDPLGTIALFFSGLFGWAKPVPINPRYFKHISRDMMWVALAGPLSNLFLAAVSALAHRVFLMGGFDFLRYIPGAYEPLSIMVEMSVIMNISLAVFNMVPVPPLDGSKVLSNLLPARSALSFSRLEPYGFIILILLIMSGFLNRFVSPLVYFMVGLLTGGI